MKPVEQAKLCAANREKANGDVAHAHSGDKDADVTHACWWENN